MTGARAIDRLIACAAAAAAAGIAVSTVPTFAQTLRPTILTDGPLPPLRKSIPRRPDVSIAEPDAQPRRAQQPPRRVDETGPATESETDDATPTAPSGMRSVVRDGEPEAEQGPQAPADGPEGEAESYVNPDGTDPITWDSRTDEDVAPFERPAAGYDPDLYRAEITPLLDRRPERLFRFEPWQPRGVRIGSFIALPSVDIGGAFLSNILRGTPARPDRAFELRPTLAMRSDWRTHALELRATGGFTWFDQFPKEDDRAWQVEGRGRLDITKRTALTGLLLHDVVQETRGTLESRLRGSGPRADVTTDQAAFDLGHTFNRLTINLRGSVLSRSYSDVVLTDTGTGAGTSTVSNRDRDLTATEQAVRATWAFKPTLLGFVETAVNQREFRAPSFSDGISRNSSGERFRAGVGFGNTSQILRGEVSVGWGEQRPDDRRLSKIDGLLVDANLAWRIDGKNALLLRANTDVLETSTAGSSGGFLRRGSLEWRHAFLKPLIGTASIAQSATTYETITLTEQQTDIALGLEYYLAPEALLYGRWQHSMYRTTGTVGDWDGDEFRVGMRLRQ